MDWEADPAAVVAEDDGIGAIEWVPVEVTVELEVLGEVRTAEIPPAASGDGGDPRHEVGDCGHGVILTHRVLGLPADAER